MRRFDRAQLSHLSVDDQERFERWGQGTETQPPHRLIHRAVEAQAQAQPNAIAVEHEGTSISYGELDRRANRLARHLRDVGVGRGDNVALFLHRSIELVVAQLATVKLGAAYVPQHVGVSPERQLRYVLDVIDPPIVLTLSSFTDRLPVTDEPVLALDEFFAIDPAEVDELTPPPPPVEVDPDDDCFILFTSGTTGNPNGVRVTHANVTNILLTEPGNLGMGPGRTVAQILSIAFDMAAWETLGALMNGATLLLRGADIQAAAARANVIIATPTILGTIDPKACPSVEVAAVAGEPCPQPLADRWGAICTFYNSCGPTETTIINTAQQYRPELGGLSIGTPTPNNTVYVLDEHRRPLPIGEVGEMWAGGDCVTAGYLANQELTDERYALDPFLGDGRMMFRTRDLGRWNDRGELEHFGRTDDQVKVRGFRVELDSVSAALESVEGCTAAVTLKLDNSNLVAFVQPATVDPTEARDAVAAALPYYCVPAIVTALDELPRTDRGKVDKQTLRASLETLTTGTGCLTDTATNPLADNSNRETGAS